ncbi:hypothetical protein [Methylorubrum sp. SL192]|uniref:hypothetical protein n=1 Tax=Methylorubrum sp. SL192 TaxID=2995167 RepID=UPI0022737B39|nr:hypothetical protein [Methylorubrum sp. SL192]MCY1640680.1 hypothetical protein [Methylorubrum sp. SL192]
MVKATTPKVAKPAKNKDDVERLPPTPQTLKKLFAYSGNQCAFPDCTNQLVDPSGTLLGKVAHICAAEKGGPRFDGNMTNEQRRAFDNLVIFCGKHHDIVDDKANVPTYPPDKLKGYKKSHEDRFRRAERQLLDQYNDATQAIQPTYPKTLARLGAVFNEPALVGSPDHISDLVDFIDRLKELPLDVREFALKLAERMRRNNVDELLVQEVIRVFSIGQAKLNDIMKIMERAGLGDIDDGKEFRTYVVTLREKKWGGSAWFEILEFCGKTGVTPDKFIFDLRFDLYDQ